MGDSGFNDTRAVFSAGNGVGTVFAYILVVLVKVEIFYGKKACKIGNRCYLNTGSELSLLTITDDRIFIEKLANFSIKANAASRAVPVC